MQLRLLFRVDPVESRELTLRHLLPHQGSGMSADAEQYLLSLRVLGLADASILLLLKRLSVSQDPEPSRAWRAASLPTAPAPYQPELEI